MPSDRTWFTEISNGKFRINSRSIYRNLSSEIVIKLAQNLSVSEILDWMKTKQLKLLEKSTHKIPKLALSIKR
nr:Cfr10I/Bse634I family restriction endonuclease [Nostoc sp. MG11]